MSIKVQLGHKPPIKFRLWHPELGPVFARRFAFDTETTMIDKSRPRFTPAYVVGAACDGRRGYFVARDHVAAFIDAHQGVDWVMHNAPFDLAVLNQVARNRDIYGLVDEDRVLDTQLLHRLYVLGTAGHVAFGQSSLQHCAQHHLGIELPKDGKDAEGRDIRTSYGRYLSKPFETIPKLYLEYLAKDALATWRLYRELIHKHFSLLQGGEDEWGFVSDDWLWDCVGRWGLQTHHIQLRAAIVLQSITAHGLPIDLGTRGNLKQGLQTLSDQLRESLKRHGYMPGQKGCRKALQEIMRRIDLRYPDLELPRTPSGELYETKQESLAHLGEMEPFIKNYLQFQGVEKLLHTFVDKMSRSVIHPSFNPLVVTGRTSSFGDINAQNLPRDNRVRHCIAAPPGRVFIDADYSAIEMATLAESIQSQFGERSALALAINRGQDVHRLVAAKVTGKRESDITKKERDRAKAINFGKPGGMGNPSLKRYAKASYGVDLDDAEVEQLSEGWFNQYPEMRIFLQQEGDTGAEIAELFGLTPWNHFEYTQDNRFMYYAQKENRVNEPSAALGGMFLKAMKIEQPSTNAGRSYSDSDLNYFWHKAKVHIDRFPSRVHGAILARRPSQKLWLATLGLVGRRGVYTLTGRLRANASYCARHNTVFQGLAADGAKLGLWYLWRAGYMIHNFIHDEVLISVPDDHRVGLHAQIIRELMIRGMRDVVPNVRVDVKYVVSDRWTKDDKLQRDEAGHRIALRVTESVA